MSCSSVRLVRAPSGRAAEDEEEPSLYTDEDYAELEEEAFEAEDEEELSLYTDQDYAELEEEAFENY